MAATSIMSKKMSINRGNRACIVKKLAAFPNPGCTRTEVRAACGAAPTKPLGTPVRLIS